jgi:hypothetical protein
MQDWETRAGDYWSKARLFVKNGTTDPKNPPWVELRIGDALLPVWVAYFRWRLGNLPAGLRMLETGKCSSFLVPCERPEWFDVEYPSPPEEYIPAWPVSHRTDLSDASAARVARLASSMRVDPVREDRRDSYARRARETTNRQIEALNAAEGISVSEGSIPVSPMLRAKLTPPRQEAAE